MKQKLITIWTYGYNAFVFGGHVYYPLKTSLLAEGPFSLGKGYKGYVVIAPDKRAFVAESQTGALVGNASTKDLALQVVRKDISEGTKEVMEKQIKHAREELKRGDAKHVLAEEFWRMMKHD